MSIDFLVVGAMKSGTTSLHKYLSTNPELFLPKKKEVNFFAKDEEFSKGLAYYEEYFSDNMSKVCGEVSPLYMMIEASPERIFNAYPEMKIIMVLRDPIKRALSHHNMMRKRDEEKTEWSEWVGQLESGIEGGSSTYISCGLYGASLQKFMRYFDRESIHIIFMEELESDPVGTMQKISNFLGVSNDYDNEVLNSKFHQAGTYKYPRFTRLLRKLVKFLAKYKAMVYKLMPTKLRELISQWLWKYETQINIKPISVPDLTDKDINTLLKYFEDDLTLFNELSGLDNPWYPAK